MNAIARAVLADSANTPFGLSAISIWEVCTQFRKTPEEVLEALAEELCGNEGLRPFAAGLARE